MGEKEKRKLEPELSVLTISEMMNLYKHLFAEQLDDLYYAMPERIVGENSVTNGMILTIQSLLFMMGE